MACRHHVSMIQKPRWFTDHLGRSFTRRPPLTASHSLRKALCRIHISHEVIATKLFGGTMMALVGPQPQPEEMQMWGGLLCSTRLREPMPFEEERGESQTKVLLCLFGHCSYVCLGVALRDMKVSAKLCSRSVFLHRFCKRLSFPTSRPRFKERLCNS